MGSMLSLAALQAPPAGGRTGTVLMIYMVAFAFIMWFLIIRPQRKVQEKHKTMLVWKQQLYRLSSHSPRPRWTRPWLRSKL